jgi:hypothetical protein
MSQVLGEQDPKFLPEMDVTADEQVTEAEN